VADRVAVAYEIEHPAKPDWADLAASLTFVAEVCKQSGVQIDGFLPMFATSMSEAQPRLDRDQPLPIDVDPIDSVFPAGTTG